MIDIATRPAGVVVTVSGELDLSARADTEAVLRRLAVRGRANVIIDLCRMTFMDSTGAAWIAALVDQDRNLGGATTIRGAKDRDLFVLDICGILSQVTLDRSHHCTAPTSATA